MSRIQAVTMTENILKMVVLGGHITTVAHNYKITGDEYLSLFFSTLALDFELNVASDVIDLVEATFLPTTLVWRNE